MLANQTSAVAALEGVSVAFGGRHVEHRIQALTDIDLEIAADEVVGVVGESGCGKTTLGRVVVGLQKPTKGQVRVAASAINGEPIRPLTQRVSMIFQDPRSSLNPRMTIDGILRDPFVVHSIGDRAFRARRVTEMLVSVGLSPGARRRKPHQMSGGQLQRVAIARSLALYPDLVVADEPTSALDVSVQVQIVKLIRELRAQRSFALVLISHDMRIIRALADRVVVMYAGVLVEDAPAERLFARPHHPYTKALLSAAPRLDGSNQTRIQLKDSTPTFHEPPARCPFMERCWKVTPECGRELPALDAGGPGVRCIHPE